MVELRGISKYFSSNGVRALENAGLTLRPGEIHALLGENGTGKSTLMHILAGYFPPSSGTVLVDGKERRFSSPAAALALGIGMVRQHPGFIRGFKVWEDCVLGAERLHSVSPDKGRGLFFDSRGARKRAAELSERWNFGLPLDKDSESLTVNQRQKAAVLALLLRDVRWFIFDEPTAVLTPGESGALFELLGRLKSEGRGVILITHKLDEALRVSDRLTVIRRGITRETVNTGTLSVDALKNAIFGGAEFSSARNTLAEPEAHVPPAERETPGPAVLSIKNLSLEPPGLPYIWNASLELAPGRILGIAGVRDSGLETLELAVAGLLRHPGKIKGSVLLNGRDITGKGVRAFRAAGGAYLGADRLRGSLAPELPLRESLIIHAFRRARKKRTLQPGRLSLLGLSGFLDTRYLDSWCRNIMKRAGIPRQVSDRADSFSGGMLQRVLLAREFAEDASLVVLAEAGSGLDAARRLKLEEELKALARSGRAVLLFSTDVEELLSVADEIMVLKNGTFTARFVLRPAVPAREGAHGETPLSAAEARSRINSAMTETETRRRDFPGENES